MFAVFVAFRCTAEELMTEYIPYLHINNTTLHDYGIYCDKIVINYL